MHLLIQNSSRWLGLLFLLIAACLASCGGGKQQKSEAERSKASTNVDSTSALSVWENHARDIYAYDSTIKPWLDSLKHMQLALSDSQLDSLLACQTCLRESRERIASRYDALLAEIQRKRNSLCTEFAQAKDSLNIKVLHKSEATLDAIIERLLFPLWVGGLWDMYGVPQSKPDPRNPVACGHLVQKLLTDAGFNIQKNKGAWLAYLAPDDFIGSFTQDTNFSYSGWDGFSKALNEMGSGFYIIGLSCGWGHVLLCRYYGGDDLLLMHSGPRPTGACVAYDNGKQYISSFCGDVVWALKIDDSLVRKWLLKTPILPLASKE